MRNKQRPLNVEKHNIDDLTRDTTRMNSKLFS